MEIVTTVAELNGKYILHKLTDILTRSLKFSLTTTSSFFFFFLPFLLNSPACLEENWPRRAQVNPSIQIKKKKPLYFYMILGRTILSSKVSFQNLASWILLYIYLRVILKSSKFWRLWFFPRTNLLKLTAE